MTDGSSRKLRRFGSVASWLAAVLGLLVGCATVWAVEEGDEIRVARWPAPLRELNKKHEVRLVHFVPRDRRPADSFQDKIRVAMTFVADLYRRDLRAKGYETEGLDFEFDDALPVVHLLRGERMAAYYTGAPDYNGLRQWRKIVAEVRSELGPITDHAYVVFPQTWDKGRAKHAWPGDVALGARFSDDGGMALVPGWMLMDEFAATTVMGEMRLLADDTPIEGRTALGHGKKNSPRFEFIEDALGAVAHEMGHVFGLPHDHRKPWKYVMANGFRRLRENYLSVGEKRPVQFSEDNARILAQSRFLASTLDPGDRKPPEVKVEVDGPLHPGHEEVKIRMQATDDGELAAALFFVSHKDSVVEGCALAGGKAELARSLPAGPLEEGAFELMVLVADEGGRLGSTRVKCKVCSPADAPSSE